MSLSSIEVAGDCVVEGKVDIRIDDDVIVLMR
jgi:hypothetical protein